MHVTCIYMCKRLHPRLKILMPMEAVSTACYGNCVKQLILVQYILLKLISSIIYSFIRALETKNCLNAGCGIAFIMDISTRHFLEFNFVNIKRGGTK